MGHHYVPQQYLRGFADPSRPKSLWQFDKQTRRFSAEPLSIKQIAQKRAFYSEDTERSLAEMIEKPGNRILKKLRAGDLVLSNGERETLSVYIATMTHRVPRHRDRANEIAPQSLINVTNRLRDQIRGQLASGRLSFDAAKKRRAEIDDVQAKFSARMPADVQEHLYKPWPTERVVGAIYEMSWRFAHSTDGLNFVTTDNPAFFFSGFGLGTPNSELTFPISSDLAIFGYRASVRGTDKIVCDAHLVEEANNRLISCATRFIYFRSNAAWIATVAATEPLLNRICW